MLSKKISNLVPKQLPSFVTEQYPRFVSFIEAYYEFLEKEHPSLNISNNNLLEKTEKLKFLSDVDVSLDEFEQQFFNSFLPYFSKNTAANKDLIIKNILPLYLSKGSEKSFRLLFRMLFDESVFLSYPRDNILRASDGRWNVQNVLRISDYFYCIFTGDGIKNEFYLPEQYDITDFVVTIDSIETTNFIWKKEYKKIVFDTAPALNSEIKIILNNFDANILKSTLIVGQTSGATALIEYINKTRTGLTPFYEFFVDSKNLLGTFLNNETLKTIVNDISIYFRPYSTLLNIQVIDGGASYNIGDSVPIYGDAEQAAQAIIDDVYSGVVDSVIVNDGGAGFKVNNELIAEDYDTGAFLGRILSVDDTGQDSANSLTFNSDVIANALSTTISSTYSFFSANSSATLGSTISETLANVTISGLGPITSINVETSIISSTISPTFDAIPTTVVSNLTIRDFGVLSKITIIDGGENYSTGEYIVFTDNGSFRGYGANAEITGVDSNGSITQITLHSGGLDYDKENFPILSIDTVSGTNAVIAIASIMGDGESVSATYASEPPGKIKSIRLTYPGLNYFDTAVVDLTSLGNGQATAIANNGSSLVLLPGVWKTDDGKISTREIKLQGNDYYIDFSYVINAGVEFKKYKEILKNLLHPAGLVSYSKYTAEEVECSSILNINITQDYESYLASSTTVTVDSIEVTVDIV